MGESTGFSLVKSIQTAFEATQPPVQSVSGLLPQPSGSVVIFTEILLKTVSLVIYCIIIRAGSLQFRFKFVYDT